MAAKLYDGDVLRLIDRILESGDGVLGDAYEMTFFPDDDLLAVLRPRGLPIGNLTSQFWANVSSAAARRIDPRPRRPTTVGPGDFGDRGGLGQPRAVRQHGWIAEGGVAPGRRPAAGRAGVLTSPSRSPSSLGMKPQPS